MMSSQSMLIFEIVKGGGSDQNDQLSKISQELKEEENSAQLRLSLAWLRLY